MRRRNGKASVGALKVYGNYIPHRKRHRPRRTVHLLREAQQGTRNEKPNPNPNLNRNNQRPITTLRYQLSKCSKQITQTIHSQQIKGTKRGFDCERGVPPGGNWEPRVYNLGLRSWPQSNATTSRAITQLGNNQGLIGVN